MSTPLEGSAFTVCTCNLGPRTVCRQHRDSEDLGFGTSSTFVYGPFDGSKGGHLVLHEARLVIRLNPGDLIFFPSACLTHQNLPIQEGDKRRSLVLYSSGALPRFLAQGCQSRDAWKSTVVGTAEMEAHDRQGNHRWRDGWALYSNLRELELSALYNS